MRRTSLLRTGTSTFAVENFCFGQKKKVSLSQLPAQIGEKRSIPMDGESRPAFAGILHGPDGPVSMHPLTTPLSP